VWLAVHGRLCKHNISNFGVVGIVAACAGVASITEARQKVLWQVRV
jgi:hypothetical protein